MNLPCDVARAGFIALIGLILGVALMAFVFTKRPSRPPPLAWCYDPDISKSMHCIHSDRQYDI